MKQDYFIIGLVMFMIGGIIVGFLVHESADPIISHQDIAKCEQIDVSYAEDYLSLSHSPGGVGPSIRVDGTVYAITCTTGGKDDKHTVTIWRKP
jgi:hypothetical protein